MFSLRIFLGIGGVKQNESPKAIRWCEIFGVLILLVLLWLPLQWYLEYQGYLPFLFIQIADWLVWFVFLAETVTLLVLVKDKSAYLLTNWLNLVIIILAFPSWSWLHGSSYIALLRLLRYLRLLILFRLVSTEFRLMKRLLQQNRFGSTLLAFVVLILVSGIWVSYLDPSIGGPWNGLWWAWETAATVGYGDIVPHTLVGRVMAGFLMMMGICLISLIAANFAAFLIKRSGKREPHREILEGIERLEKRLEKLERGLAAKPKRRAKKG